MAYRYRTSDSHDDGPSTWMVSLQIAAVLWAMTTAPAAILIGIVADTWAGRAFAVGAILTALAPVMALWGLERRARKWTRASTVGIIVAIVIAYSIAMRAPDGVASDHARVTSQYRPDQTKYPRFGLTNLLPEEDQLLAGFTVMSWFDPLFDSAQAAELKRMTRGIYRELEGDPEFRAVGSAMRITYGDLTGFRTGYSHVYTYVPARVDRKQPAPILVFFHGSGGNFKAYLWILREIADRTGIIVVCPSGGIGAWLPSQTEAAYAFALEAAARVATIDRNRVHIAGLSNGGRAISQLAAGHGSAFASIVFLSPVFDTDALNERSFSTECRDRPMLVLTGTRDNRVPLDYVESVVAHMRATAPQTELKTFDHADHFLVFSRRTEVVRVLADWVGKR